jgi:hypothetical protein
MRDTTSPKGPDDVPPKSLAERLLDEGGLRGDPTFETLKDMLGEERAAHVITRIGEMALKEAPGLKDVALGSIVSQTLARLSPKQWTSLAKGENSALIQAQSIVQEAVKAQQAAQVGNNGGQNATAAHDAGKNGALAVANAAGLNGKNGGKYANMKDGGSSGGDAHSASYSVAVSYAKQLGIDPALAPFFVGTSSVMREALRDAINNGTTIRDDQVKNMHDVGAVIGAIRAGKLSPDDPRIPQSVRQIMDDMRAKGIDPIKADPKVIKKYLDDHPDALKQLKKVNSKDVAAQGHMTKSEKTDQMEAALQPEKEKKDSKPKPKETAEARPNKPLKLNVS